MAIDPWVKRPTEVKRFRMHFGNHPEIADYADTLTGTPTVAVSPTGPTLASAAISGTEVRVTVSGGTDDTDYTLTFTVSTTAGSTLVETITLQVRAGP
jgi:hypothetical protein